MSWVIYVLRNLDIPLTWYMYVSKGNILFKLNLGIAKHKASKDVYEIKRSSSSQSCHGWEQCSILFTTD